MKKKIIIATSLVLAIAVAVFGLLTFLDHQKQEKAKQEREKYEKLFLYTGKWKIDSYEFLEDGRGVAVHWKSQTKKEDDLVLKYGSKTSRNYLNNIHGASNEDYIVRENMKLDSYKPKIMSSKNNSENYYTLSIYKIANKRLGKLYQTGMLFPHFLSWVIVSYFVFSFLSADKGMINSMLGAFGIEPVQWYSEAKYWPFILVFMNCYLILGNIKREMKQYFLFS